MFVFKELDGFIDYWLTSCLHYEGSWSSSTASAFSFSRTVRNVLSSYVAVYVEQGRTGTKIPTGQNLWGPQCCRAHGGLQPARVSAREIFGYFIAGCILYIAFLCILNTYFRKGASSDIGNLPLSQWFFKVNPAAFLFYRIGRKQKILWNYDYSTCGRVHTFKRSSKILHFPLKFAFCMQYNIAY